MKRLLCIIAYLILFGTVIYYTPDVGVWLTQHSTKEIAIAMVIVGASFVALTLLFIWIGKNAQVGPVPLPDNEYTCDGCGYQQGCDGTVCIMEEH